MIRRKLPRPSVSKHSFFLIPPGKSFAVAGQQKGNHHSCKGRKKPGYAHFKEEGKI
jgi:hypothetical protein